MPSSSADLIVWFIEIMVKMLRKKQRKENSETVILTKEVTRRVVLKSQFLKDRSTGCELGSTIVYKSTKNYLSE